MRGPPGALRAGGARQLRTGKGLPQAALFLPALYSSADRPV
jgi:hypothetical protein